jgi:hypothetical protein
MAMAIGGVSPLGFAARWHGNETQDHVQWRGLVLTVLNLRFVIPDCQMDGTDSGSGHVGVQ